MVGLECKLLFFTVVSELEDDFEDPLYSLIQNGFV